MNHETFTDKAEHEELAAWQEAIARHLETGEDAGFYIRDHEALMAFTKLVGHDEREKLVLAWRYAADGQDEVATEPFVTNVHAAILQEQIADRGMMNEFPNDFDVSMAIAYGEKSMVVYSYDHSSEPVVCEACHTSKDEHVQEELALNEGRYGCGHEDDEYYARYHAAMMVIPDDTGIISRALQR